MTEILKFRQETKTNKRGKENVTQADIQDMEVMYQERIFEKEEQQLQQESDFSAKQEEIKKIEATIAALEKHYNQVQRENR